MWFFSKCYTPAILFCLAFFMKDYLLYFWRKIGRMRFWSFFLNRTFPFTMKQLSVLLVWNQVQDNIDWNSDIQSLPFEMKMFPNHTTAFSNPQCFKCTLKWGNLFLPVRCIILRERLIFAVWQVTGCPISSPTACSGIIEGQWEKIHYAGNFPHFRSEKVYLYLEDSGEEKKKS